MSKISKLTKIAAGVGAALLLSYGTTASADISGFSPSAYAESELFVTNFSIIDLSTGLHPVVCPGAGCVLDNLKATVTSTMSASINGVPGIATPSASEVIDPLTGSPTIVQRVSAGPDAANYVAYGSYGPGTMGNGVFAGAASDHSGNALELNGNPLTTATTQAQVNINGSSAQGAADARQQLGTDFTMTVTEGALFFVSFDAETYFRIALGQEDVQAGASRNWNMTVTQKGALGTLLDWTPKGNFNDLSGDCFDIFGTCAVTDDPFSLNFSATLQSQADLDQTNAVDTFGLLVFLTPGDYTISLDHKVGADAHAIAAVPEPGSLALLGAALMALTGMRRKSKQV